MENSFKNKVELLITRYFEGKDSLFHDKCGLSHNYMHRLRTSKNPQPSLQSVNQIIDSMMEIEPDFNPLWLVRDAGPMIVRTDDPDLDPALVRMRRAMELTNQLEGQRREGRLTDQQSRLVGELAQSILSILGADDQ